MAYLLALMAEHCWAGWIGLGLTTGSKGFTVTIGPDKTGYLKGNLAKTL